MQNISFQAKLVVNENLYKNLPPETPSGYSENLVQEYRDFLNKPVIKKVTQDDTIELYRAKYPLGFAIGIRYTNDKNGFWIVEYSQTKKFRT